MNIFNYVLEVLKLAVSSIGPVGSIVKKEKAPAAVVPSSTPAPVASPMLALDSKDIAIFLLCLALIFASMAAFTLATRRA